MYNYCFARRDLSYYVFNVLKYHILRYISCKYIVIGRLACIIPCDGLSVRNVFIFECARRIRTLQLVARNSTIIIIIILVVCRSV